MKVEVAQLTGSLNMANDTRRSLEANRAKEEQCDEDLNRVEEQIARCENKVTSYNFIDLIIDRWSVRKSRTNAC